MVMCIVLIIGTDIPSTEASAILQSHTHILPQTQEPGNIQDLI